MEQENKKTQFTTIYNRFLDKITDDMYVELTPSDTMKDLQRLLINALPNFEFPRKNLYDYELKTSTISEEEIEDGDFILGIIWGNIEEESEEEEEEKPQVLIEQSKFNMELTSEEINILALLMLDEWIQRQITSIENTRMKYSSSDFKMTSQANHLSKLLNLQNEIKRQGFHMQRLYKRRKIIDNGEYRSNWTILAENSAISE